MKSYSVKLIFRVIDIVEVEAENEEEAEKKAIQESEINPGLAELYDCIVRETVK